jgi:hypothetical protein
MIELLQTKLDTLNYNLNNDIIAKEGLMFMLGQQELLMELLNSHYSMMQDHYDAYYEQHEDEYWAVDEWDMHINDLEYYKQQEIENMFDKKDRDFIWYVGKDVMNINNLWFTSDEIEAFKEIWQRRISAI